jgi:hypothetical protein
MCRFFHFFITGEIVAFQRIFEWTKQSKSQKEPYQDYTDHASTPQDQLAEGFNSVGGSVRMGIIVQHHNIFQQ